MKSTLSAVQVAAPLAIRKPPVFAIFLVVLWVASFAAAFSQKGGSSAIPTLSEIAAP